LHEQHSVLQTIVSQKHRVSSSLQYQHG